MSGFLTDFGIGGGAATTSIVNAFSSGGVSLAGVQASATNGAREVLSGALTSATLATLLTVTGSGEVPFLTAYAKDSTARTIRIQVTVDGVIVFDATSASVGAADSGLSVIGLGLSTGFFVPAPAPLAFNSSLVVKVASSLSETNKVAIGYILNKRGG